MANIKKSVKKVAKALKKTYSGKVDISEGNDCIVLSGEVERWSDVVTAGMIAATEDPDVNILNKMTCTVDKPIPVTKPRFEDAQLEFEEPDVLIIGGGIIGCAIARELTRYSIKILLVDKESDLATQATGHSHGLIHSGARLRRGSLKQWYTMLGNQKMETICTELGVPFRRTGQYIINTKRVWKFILMLTRLYYTFCGHKEVRIAGRTELSEKEPGISDYIGSALFFPSGGAVDPQQLAIAYAENAVQNGATVSLNTMVQGMKVEGGKILGVKTNRGTVIPKIVINAAGLFCEEIAEMAEDSFYSIHPVKSTNAVIDKKHADDLVNTAISIHGKNKGKRSAPDKLTNVVRTVHGSVVAGTAVMETLNKEDYSTDRFSADWTINTVNRVIAKLDKKKALKYYSGINAATYNGDYIVSEGKAVSNIVHIAGIQFPGITAAPAIAEDVVKMVTAMFGGVSAMQSNPDFNPVRKTTPDTDKLDLAALETLVSGNPDFGVIVCHCENVSRGEIIDSLNRDIPCDSLDGVKRRTHACCGDCQGECCTPSVMKLIASQKHISLQQVVKKGKGSEVVYAANAVAIDKKENTFRTPRQEHDSDTEMLHKLHRMGSL